MKAAYRLLPVAMLALLSCAAPADAEVVTKNEKIAGTTLHYKVILPEAFDASKTYPAVLAFPGGGQTMQIVEGMIARNLKAESERRGYITVIAAAPTEGLFFQGGDRVFPEFLDKLLKDYKIRDGKFHAVGISNGGISAFHVAARYPRYFWTVTGLPGYLQDGNQYMNALKGMCIHMYVGETDSGWLQSMSAQSKQFQAAGISTTFSIEKGQGHVMRTLEGAGAARIFGDLDKEAKDCAN